MAKRDPPVLNVAAEIPQGPVPAAALDKLTSFLAEPLRCPVFSCVVCGKARQDPNIIDPGVLHMPRLCSQAGLTCHSRAHNFEPTPLEYWPGSIVAAKCKDRTGWPAIVEFSTDDISDYCLRRGSDITPHAYYLTFIGADRHRPIGGWFSASNIRPIEANDLERIRTTDRELRDALLGVRRFLEYGTLHRRILELSNIAAELRRTGFKLDELPVAGRWAGAEYGDAK